MQQTGYLPLQTISKLSASLVGGICKFWYTPIQNIALFPVINPLTQMLDAEPSLKDGTTWYGPVNIPDSKRGWKQKPKRSKPGLSYIQQVTGIIPGNTAANHINLANLAEHQLCIVAKLRSGGFYIILGNPDSGMDLNPEEGTGLGQFEAAGTTLSFDWEGEALVLPSFLGNSYVPPVIINPPPVDPPPGNTNFDVAWDYVQFNNGVPTSNTSQFDLVTLTHTAQFTAGANISLPIPSAPDDNHRLVIRYPLTETDKTHWYNTALNNGAIPDQTFLQVIANAQFKYIVSRVGGLGVDNSSPLIFS